MKNDPCKIVLSLAALLMALLILPATGAEAEPPSTTANPDFTQGGQVPAKATHDWNLRLDVAET